MLDFSLFEFKIQFEIAKSNSVTKSHICNHFMAVFQTGMLGTCIIQLFVADTRVEHLKGASVG